MPIRETLRPCCTRGGGRAERARKRIMIPLTIVLLVAITACGTPLLMCQYRTVLGKYGWNVSLPLQHVVDRFPTKSRALPLTIGACTSHYASIGSFVIGVIGTGTGNSQKIQRYSIRIGIVVEYGWSIGPFGLPSISRTASRGSAIPSSMIHGSGWQGRHQK